MRQRIFQADGHGPDYVQGGFSLVYTAYQASGMNGPQGRSKMRIGEDAQRLLQ